MNIWKITLVAFSAIIIFSGNANAGVDIKDFYTPAAIVHEILLICAVICLIWSMKVLSMVKGGLMSKSWQMFVIGFCFLIFAQLASIGDSAGLVVFPGYIISLIYLLMAFTWLLGLYQMRKVLG